MQIKINIMDVIIHSIDSHIIIIISIMFTLEGQFIFSYSSGTKAIINLSRANKRTSYFLFEDVSGLRQAGNIQGHDDVIAVTKCKKKNWHPPRRSAGGTTHHHTSHITHQYYFFFINPQKITPQILNNSQQQKRVSKKRYKWKTRKNNNNHPTTTK